MILFYVLLSLAQATPVPRSGTKIQISVNKHPIGACGVCKQERQICTRIAVRSPEAAIEIEECDDAYQECFNRNHCYSSQPK